MIGLDTNVLVCYLVQYDEAQSSISFKIIDGLTRDNPGFISSVVLAKTSRVLGSSYKLGREEIGEMVEALLRSNNLVSKNTEANYCALAVCRDGSSVDIAYTLNAETAKLSGARKTVTFDPKRVRRRYAFAQ